MNNQQSKAPMKEENARFAIDGAIAFGMQGTNKPPTDDHWLMEYWQIGAKLAALEAQLKPQGELPELPKHHGFVGEEAVYYRGDMREYGQLCRASRDAQPAPALTDERPKFAPCPITRRDFFMEIHHPELGNIQTYGGPFDSYGIPYLDEDGDLRCEHFDHDRGEWIEGGASLGYYLTSEQPNDCHLPYWLDRYEPAILQAAQPVAPRHASDMLYYAAAALLHACIDADKREELGDVDGTLLDRMAQAMADYEDVAKLHPAVAQPQGDLPIVEQIAQHIEAIGTEFFCGPKQFAAQSRKAVANAVRRVWQARAALAQHKEVSKAAQDVLAERQRQVTAEGWEPEHDDEHACEELAAFACFYAMPPAAREWDASSTGYGNTLGEAIKPYDWQAKVGDRRRELVKAGALVIAEIERIDRSAAPSQGTQQVQQP